jgi:LmeA-like phospholipid-binding
MTTEVIEVPRKRHRGRRALIILLIVVIVLVAGFFVADYFAKKYATSYVQQQVAKELDLTSTRSVDVDLGSGSILLQALSGRIDDVSVKVDPLVVNGLSGSATLVAHGVPLSTTVPVTSLGVSVRIPSSTIHTAITQIPSLAPYKPTVAIGKKDVDVAATVSVFGLPQRVGVTLSPKVTKGKPGFAIESAEFDGVKISATALDRYIPGVAAILHSGVSLCIANELPKSFKLTGISLKGQSLVSTFSGDGVRLNSASLSQKGICPAS